MLFTDGSISRLEELAAHDAGLMEVAGSEGIDVSGKMGLAQDELGIELAALLPQSESQAGLAGVVVTPALKLWHVFRTLELVYRDAYNTRLNDRYKGKWEECRRLGKWAMEKLLEAGVGIAANPVPKAEKPELAGGMGMLADGLYLATVAWVNAAGEEGAAAECASLALSASSSLVVMPVNAPASARGWNVYVGLAEESLFRQNQQPVALGEPWVQSETPLATGKRPGTGQRPGWMRSVPRVLQRG